MDDRLLEPLKFYEEQGKQEHHDNNRKSFAILGTHHTRFFLSSSFGNRHWNRIGRAAGCRPYSGGLGAVRHG